jgi:predicted transcriptional regulator
MSSNNYFTVSRWMVSKLHLSGNDLLVYAIIYGFSQDGESRFYGSAKYIADSIGTSRRAVMNILERLTKSGLLIKESEYSNGVKNCFYKACTNFIGYEESSQGDMKKVHRGYEESSHNNIDDNKEDIKDNSCAFAQFWKAYPKKKAKGSAEKAWNKIDSSLLTTILEAIENQKQSPQWKKEGGQYIPYPATWLNSKSWEDEVEVADTQDSSIDLEEFEQWQKEQV